jgi:hypothetical protein
MKNGLLSSSLRESAVRSRAQFGIDGSLNGNRREQRQPSQTKKPSNITDRIAILSKVICGGESLFIEWR